MGKKNRKAKKRMEKRARKAQKRMEKKERARLERARAKAGRSGSGGQARRDPRKRRRAARRRLLRRLLLLALLALIAGLCVLMGYAVKSLPVTDIVVEGESPYSNELLLETCGLSEGQALLLLRPNAMEKTLLARMPWLESVEIRRHLPGTVQLTVTKAQPAYRVSDGGRQLYVAADGKVLGYLEEDPASSGVPLLLGNFVSPVEIAKTLAYETESDGRICVDIFAALQDNELLEGVSEVDLRNPSELTVMIGDRFLVKLGDSLSLPEKLRMVAESIKRLDETQTGTLDASTVGRVIHKPGTVSPPSAPKEDEPLQNETPPDNEAQQDGLPQDGTPQDETEDAQQTQPLEGETQDDG